MDKMTASELKYQYQTRGNGYFFNRSTMKFFGDTMRNYYVSAGTVVIETPTGNIHRCYELTRVHSVKHGLNSAAYFDIDTFEAVVESKK